MYDSFFVIRFSVNTSVDYVMIFDNSFGEIKFIAESIEQEELNVMNFEKFNSLKNYDEQRISRRNSQQNFGWSETCLPKHD